MKNLFMPLFFVAGSLLTSCTSAVFSPIPSANPWHGRGRRGHAGAAGGGIREKIKKGRGLSPSLFACRKPLAGRAVQKKDNADDEKSL